MKKLSPLDTLFLVAETNVSPFHAGALMIFHLADDQDEASIVNRIYESFKATPAKPPFNMRANLTARGGPRWEPMDDMDMDYHVRRVTVAQPGKKADLMELAAFLNAPVLDRSYPLWECYVIDGLADRQFALLYRVQHSYVDGASGLKAFVNSVNEDKDDDRIAPPWSNDLWARPRKPKADPNSDKKGGPFEKLKSTTKNLQQVGDIAKTGISSLNQISRNLVEMTTDMAGLTSKDINSWVHTPRSKASGRINTSARAYSYCRLPLSETKVLGKQYNSTVNDVVLTLAGIAMQRCIADNGETLTEPLIASMPLSTRAKGDDSAGNQVGFGTVSMGDPSLCITDRLREVNKNAGLAKNHIGQQNTIANAMQAMGFLSLLTLKDLIPGAAEKIPPIGNFLVSNVAGGPKYTCYLAGAELEGIYTLPIVGGQTVNATLCNIGDWLCLGFGASRELFPHTEKFSRYIEEAFQELREAAKSGNSLSSDD